METIGYGFGDKEDSRTRTGVGMDCDTDVREILYGKRGPSGMLGTTD